MGGSLSKAILGKIEKDAIKNSKSYILKTSRLDLKDKAKEKKSMKQSKNANGVTKNKQQKVSRKRSRNIQENSDSDCQIIRVIPPNRKLAAQKLQEKAKLRKKVKIEAEQSALQAKKRTCVTLIHQCTIDGDTSKCGVDCPNLIRIIDDQEYPLGARASTSSNSESSLSRSHANDKVKKEQELAKYNQFLKIFQKIWTKSQLCNATKNCISKDILERDLKENGGFDDFQIEKYLSKMVEEEKLSLMSGKFYKIG